MRKYIFLAFLGFYFACATSKASTADWPQHEAPTMGISLSPVQALLFSLNGKYHLKTHDSLVLTIPFVLENAPELMLMNRSHYYSSGAGLKYYFTGDIAKGGFYSELELSGGYSIMTPKNRASFSSAFLRSTAHVGYSWTFANRFMLSLAGGAFYNHAFSHEATVIKKATNYLQRRGFISAGLCGGFSPASEFSIGYMW